MRTARRINLARAFTAMGSYRNAHNVALDSYNRLADGAQNGAKATKDEYIGTIYGTAALCAIVSITMANARDELEERTDLLEDKKLYMALRSAEIHMEDVRRNIMDTLADNAGKRWMDDFSMAAYQCVETHIEKLRYAVANVIGRSGARLQSPSSVALLMVAQSLCAETAAYTKRRVALFRGCTMENRHGSKVSVSGQLSGMSCEWVDRYLKEAVTRILDPVLPDGLNVGGDAGVRLGCKIIMETLGKEETWVYAREKADELNKKK